MHLALGLSNTVKYIHFCCLFTCGNFPGRHWTSYLLGVDDYITSACCLGEEVVGGVCLCLIYLTSWCKNKKPLPCNFSSMKVYMALKSPPWPRLHPFFASFFPPVFYSFSVPFSNVNGNRVAEESRLFFIPERVDLISLSISSQTLMHYTVGQQFIAWPCMQVMRVARERSSFHLKYELMF